MFFVKASNMSIFNMSIIKIFTSMLEMKNSHDKSEIKRLVKLYLQKYLLLIVYNEAVHVQGGT